MGKRNSIQEAPLRSGSQDFDRLQNSAVWFDIQTLIKDRLELLQNEFLGAKTFEDIKHIQGQMTAWREMLGLPSYLKSCAEVEKETHKQQELNYED